MSGVTREQLDRAIQRVRQNRIAPLAPIHPKAHAEACRLLGKPEGSPLTYAEVFTAGQIALEHLIVGREEI